MARQSKRNTREERRREDAAVKLMALGGMFAVMPLSLGQSQLGKAFAALGPLGLAMFSAGGFLMWLARRSAVNEVRPAVPSAPPSFGSASPVGRRDSAVDRQIDEA